MHYDIIIIGSGAGGSAAAYHLTQTGKRVLLLEKGPPLPKDGSTLDIEEVPVPLLQVEEVALDTTQEGSAQLVVVGTRDMCPGG